MNSIIFGAAGFIGTNLALHLAEDENMVLTCVDKKKEFFRPVLAQKKNCSIVESEITENTDFASLLEGQDIVYHLVSTTVPSTCNVQISQEIMSNVAMTARLLDACVTARIKRVVFISSGGTVYGKASTCPIAEDAALQPISSYGLQKVMIEKMLHVYYEVHGLDYRIIRCSNPYGPYQKPNGVLGAVSTFSYKALKGEDIVVYGDGSVVRDFIYITDLIKGITHIANSNTAYKLYNLGSGHGTSIKTLLTCIEKKLGKPLPIRYTGARQVDVPENYLDITRYFNDFGPHEFVSLEDGIEKLLAFFKEGLGE